VFSNTALINIKTRIFQNWWQKKKVKKIIEGQCPERKGAN
jgi:hypothetical protein